MANRPSAVPGDATPIYPGQTFGPGLGVQRATLLSIAAQIAWLNAGADQRYARALQDWIANASIYQSLGMPVPPPPAPAVHTVLHVIYADIGGNIVQEPSGADGLHYAWIWESQ
jgi:hypothetical protein